MNNIILFSSDVNYHDIIKNEDGSSQRLLTYLLTLNYTIGPKHSDTTVKQVSSNSYFTLLFSVFTRFEYLTQFI